MKARVGARRRKSKRKRQDEQSEPLSKPAQASDSRKRELSGFYASGPAVRASRKSGRSPGNAADSAKSPDRELLSVPTVGGSGEPAKHSAHGQSVRLQGRTDANFDGGSFCTEDTRVSEGEGCDGCTGRECVHVTGTLVATYSVTTTVTLPSVPDYPDLTPCQRDRVHAAISNILAPHEQQHVAAFNTYNGTTRRSFDLTLCRKTLDASIRAMHQKEASAREAAAQTRSDTLDPFHFDVDLDCEDDESTQTQSSAGALSQDDESVTHQS